MNKQYYISIGSYETWSEWLKTQRDYDCHRMRKIGKPTVLPDGSYIICYMKARKGYSASFIGALEVVEGNPIIDLSPRGANDNYGKEFPVRYKVRQSTQFDLNNSLQLTADLISKLSFIKDKEKWGVNFQRELRSIPSVDGELIMDAIRQQFGQPNPIINQAERACRAWVILTEIAKNKKRMTYKQLGSQLEIHHRAIRHVLSEIQDYCLHEKLPPLTILVVNQQTGTPGKGFISWDADNIIEGLNKVHSFNWSQLINPFQYASGGDTLDDLAERLNENPSSAEDVYAQVKVRGNAQQVFGKAVRRAYGGKCAFSGVSISETLTAAHIVSWSCSESRYRVDPRNGLLLNASLHKLFDAELITLTEDYIVLVSETLLARKLSDSDKYLLNGLHNSKINLPSDRRLWPSRELIRKRNDTIKWAK